ncbi:MAG TPA: phosphatase PAP2 family protein [Chryseolinea sp.]
MIDQLIEYDKELLRFLNGYHTPWLDPVMLVLTETVTWLPLFLLLIYVIIKEHKKESWIILLGIALTILLADQITASIMKPYFGRLRPSQEPTLEGLIHLVQGYRGGQFGFASSHAANSFGLATFCFLAFNRTKPWVIWLFAWAAFMTYTRIYLGVHYPGDIVVGGLVGMICGWVGFKTSEWLADWHKKRRVEREQNVGESPM